MEERRGRGRPRKKVQNPDQNPRVEPAGSRVTAIPEPEVPRVEPEPEQVQEPVGVQERDLVMDERLIAAYERGRQVAERRDGLISSYPAHVT